MKSVLISIQPKWCELIASGKKMVEVRKTVPKLPTPFKCYIYCTKKKKPDEYGNIIFYKDPDGICVENGEGCSPLLTGMVIGEFVCDRVDKFAPTEKGVSFKRFSALHDTCLSLADIRAYLGSKVGYGWHISDLVIYDEPKDLAEFWSADKCPYASKDGCTYEYHCFRAGQTKRCGSTLQRPPQSWCYVEDVANERRLCPHCRKPVIPSELPQYKWQCMDCDEDFLDFECYKEGFDNANNQGNQTDNRSVAGEVLRSAEYPDADAEGLGAGIEAVPAVCGGADRLPSEARQENSESG